MKIIISDTTALITFAKSDILSLLDNLFKTIYIPRAVHNELIIKDDIVKYRIDQFDKITIKEVSDLNILENIKKFKIDKGETEAISLALELNLRLIIDEKKGRQDFISFDDAHYYFELVKKNGLRIDKKLEDTFYIRLKEIKD